MTCSICYVSECPDVHVTKMLAALEKNPDFETTLIYFVSEDRLIPAVKQLERTTLVRGDLYPGGAHPYAASGGLLGRIKQRLMIAHYRERAAAFLKNYFIEHRPDLVVGTIVQLGGDLAHRTGFHPFVVEPWGSDVMVIPFVRRHLMRSTLAILRDANAILLHSAYIGQCVRALDPALEAKQSLGPWGIDCDLFQKIPQGNDIRKELGWEDKTVLFHCRGFKHVYGLEHLLGAFAEVAAQWPKIRLLLVGSGEREHMIRLEIRRLGISEQVAIRPPVPHEKMRAYFSAADLYVQCNLSDGPSTALQEAMACELPVITTDIPGYHDILDPEKSGWLAQKGEVRSLIIALQHALEARQTWPKIGAFNRSLILAHYDWNKNYPALYDFFIRTLKKSKTS